MKKISLHKPSFTNKELRYLKNCIKSGWVTNKGKFIDLFKKRLTSFIKGKFVIPTINGTSALHISLKMANVKKEDEIIVPTLTYIATINSIIYCGASPVFMDVEKDLNLSIKKVLKFIKEETIARKNGTYNKRTKKRISAILLVHIFGNAVDIKPLLKICKEKKIKIIEDASESLGTFYNKNYLKGKHTGTVGDFGCLSFNGNKIITTGGGGAVITNSKKFYNYCNYICDQAKDDSLFSVHNEVGYNYKLSNIHSAIGCAQIEKIKKYIRKKKKIHNNYRNLFKHSSKFEILSLDTFYQSNYWLNVLEIKKQKRNALTKIIKKLKKNGFDSRPIWKLNHLQLPFRKFQNYKIKKANKIVSTHLCIPSSPDLTLKDQVKIYKLINA